MLPRWQTSVRPMPTIHCHQVSNGSTSGKEGLGKYNLLFKYLYKFSHFFFLFLVTMDEAGEIAAKIDYESILSPNIEVSPVNISHHVYCSVLCGIIRTILQKQLTDLR